MPYREYPKKSDREAEALAAWARAESSHRSLKRLRVWLVHALALAGIAALAAERLAAVLGPAVARAGRSLFGAAVALVAGALACELMVARERRRCLRRLARDRKT